MEKGNYLGVIKENGEIYRTKEVQEEASVSQRMGWEALPAALKWSIVQAFVSNYYQDIWRLMKPQEKFQAVRDYLNVPSSTESSNVNTL